MVVPLDKIDAMKPAFDKSSQREAKIIAAAKENRGVEAIKAAYKG